MPASRDNAALLMKSDASKHSFIDGRLAAAGSAKTNPQATTQAARRRDAVVMSILHFAAGILVSVALTALATST
jgi:hypothetical protein